MDEVSPTTPLQSSAAPHATRHGRVWLNPATVALLLVALAGVAIVWFAWPRGQRRGDVTIGVEGSKFVELTGPQYVAVPFTPGDAVSLRIQAVTAIPDGFRYELRYVAYGPGEHNLAPSLMGADGAPLDPRDDLAIHVPTLLPSDHQGDLFATPNTAIDLRSQYSRVMTALWIAWVALLIPLVLIGRKPRVPVVRQPRQPTVRERLQNLLTHATSVLLTAAEQADLEQLLLAFWSERLQLANVRLSAAIETIKAHPAAGPQWNLVEQWLHRSRPTEHGAAARELLAQLQALPKFEHRRGQIGSVPSRATGTES